MRLHPSRQAAAALFLVFCLSLPISNLQSQISNRPASPKIIFLRFADAAPILDALPGAAPAELQSAPAAEKASAWSAWVRRRDAQIRARLLQGEEDTLVNLLLFGTSFTARPRVSLTAMLALSANRDTPALQQEAANVGARVSDLLAALAAPGRNERLQFARRLVERRGMHPANPQDREPIRKYVLENLRRVLREQAGFRQVLDSARQLGNASEEFAERSKLYKQRGLSVDTSLQPDFALEEALKEMQKRGVLAPGAVRRVAIVGPGLDFTDKDAGYDFYPPQTVQSFAVMDTLARLGLAKLDSLDVVTLDISPRVNEHIAALQRRARQGVAYTIQLPRDPQRGWTPELVAYWKNFGNQIGAPIPAVKAPEDSGVEMRAVRVRAGVARRITPLDLNIVLQQPQLAPAQKFDLVIATNILVYYDTFEQTLALKNIENILRPGGFLLANNSLLELPAVKMKSLDYTTVVYSSRPDDGDHIVWYQRMP